MHVNADKPITAWTNAEIDAAVRALPVPGDSRFPIGFPTRAHANVFWCRWHHLHFNAPALTLEWLLLTGRGIPSWGGVGRTPDRSIPFATVQAG